MSLPVDANFNAISRQVVAKVEIYFNGRVSTPITVLHSDGLINMSILEEASADSDTPFGNVTANELTLTLLNSNGIYSPTNSNSPYYGKMRRGTMIIPYMKVADSDFISLGKFYVSEWQATITGLTASVTANDILYDIFDSPAVILPVAKNTNVHDFIEQTFDTLDIATVVDEAIDVPLAMSYSTDENSKLLSDISVGSLSICNCDHSGVVTWKSLTADRLVRATLTDSDQIISVDAEIGLSTTYDGARITYHVPQESDIMSVLSAKDITLKPGTTVQAPMLLSDVPLLRIVSAELTCPADIKITDISSDCLHVSIQTRSTQATDRLGNLEVYGTTVEEVGITLGDDSSNCLAIDNIYVQDATRAAELLEILNNFVNTTMPILKVTVRGNPLLNILDKVVVQSEQYNLNFTGLIIRQSFEYSGGLSGELTLLNADILEV